VAKTYEDFVREARTRIREISAADARKRFDAKDATFLDVREWEEVSRGSVPGAAWLPRGLLEGHVDEVLESRAGPVVVYCAAGNRSALAADVMREMGYGDVASLAGGLRAWAMGGHPIGAPRMG
jgi:rhodanese-related sulfurtransferase